MKTNHHKKTIHHSVMACLFTFFVINNVYGQLNTLYFQGGESGDNWPYTSNGASAAVTGYATMASNKKSGTTSLAVGGNNSSGGNCITGGATGNGPNMAHTFNFADVDISSTNTVTRTLSFWYGNYFPTCNGTGWDGGENLIFTPYHDGVPQSPQTIVVGVNNNIQSIQSQSFSYNIPAGINNFSFVLSITTNRNDEYLFLDNVLLESPTPLPVILVSFEGYAEQHIARLSWSTTYEENNLGFEIEKSLDGFTFETIGLVLGAGNSSNRHNYSFHDTLFSHKAYYRLKQIDHNGQFSYSEIIYLTVQTESKLLQIYPVPSAGPIFLKTYIEEQGILSIELLDLLSKVHSRQELQVEKGLQIIETNLSGLESGRYFMVIGFPSGERQLRTIQITP